ncbi:MAG: cytochrome c [Saprospiraceae bacterium]|nr:cytochrome c [Saprospiraceae bacterium]MCF8248791.1 cytochrome c [Saprospiraceae bacterium]MCF8279918.1 cytochrome c [Bacteroidales bacterium]MCF8310076.1 cytochrome c [Saprospiraceae bacterium]MCF8438976.1 cytochrome c [Saprospiraceae bacterium]
MKFNKKLLIAVTLSAFVFGTYSCQQAGKNSTGSEFIPDMAHATAYEANVLTKYNLNTWDDQSVMTRRELSQPRQPVHGTIPRGFSGSASYNGVFPSAEDAVVSTMNRMNHSGGISYTASGHVPYPYPDTEDGRNLATQQIRYNPFPITTDGLARGKELYVIYCGICHGDKGDGSGYLVRDNGGKYPAQPANLVDSQFIASSNGRYYHAIMYGRNAMGGYADKLSFEERWQVTHFIRSLQAGVEKAKYTETANTLNADFGFPFANIPKVAPVTEKPKEPTLSDDPTASDPEPPTSTERH